MIDKDKIQMGDVVKLVTDSWDDCQIYATQGNQYRVVPKDDLAEEFFTLDSVGKDIFDYNDDNFDDDFELVKTSTKHTDVQEGDLVEVALVSEDKLKLWPTMEQLIGKTATVQRKGHQLELYFEEPISVPGFKEQQYEFIFDAHELRLVSKKQVFNFKAGVNDSINITLNCQVPIEPIPNTLRIGDEPVSGPIKSDGGSSSYYDLPLMGDLLKEIDSRRVGDVSYIKTEELIQTVFKNNFSFGTLFKSLIRAQSVVDGVGKAGNDLEYECNKIIYYANQIKELYGNK